MTPLTKTQRSSVGQAQDLRLVVYRTDLERGLPWGGFSLRALFYKLGLKSRHGAHYRGKELGGVRVRYPWSAVSTTSGQTLAGLVSLQRSTRRRAVGGDTQWLIASAPSSNVVDSDFHPKSQGLVPPLTFVRQLVLAWFVTKELSKTLLHSPRGCFDRRSSPSHICWW